MQVLEHHTSHHNESRSRRELSVDQGPPCVPRPTEVTSSGDLLEMQMFGPTESETVGEGPGIWVLTSQPGDSENKVVGLRVTQGNFHIPDPTA